MSIKHFYSSYRLANSIDAYVITPGRPRYEATLFTILSLMMILFVLSERIAGEYSVPASLMKSGLSTGPALKSNI